MNLFENAYSSQTLRDVLKDMNLPEDVFVSDFVQFAQDRFSAVHTDKDSEFYAYPGVDGLEFYAWNHGETDRETLRTEVQKIIQEQLSVTKYCFWIEALFEMPYRPDPGRSQDFQKLNWILEEIYSVLEKIPELMRLELGKVSQKGDIPSSVDAFYQRNKSALLEKIQAGVKQKKEEIGWFDVLVELDGNSLSAEIRTADPTEPDVRYYFYLLQNGKVIDKQGWFSENCFHWKLKDSGMYCVQGYVRRGTTSVFRKSAPLGYFDKQICQEFEQFLTEEPAGGHPYESRLRLYQAEDPFANFLIVASRANDKPMVDRFIASNPWLSVAASTTYGKVNAYALANGGFRTDIREKKTIMFSGTTIYNGKLVIGINDIADDMPLDALTAGCGAFTYACIGRDTLEVRMDYGSISKWFYYEDEDRLILANHYHMLLEFLTEYDIPLKLNEKKAAITLSCVKANLFDYNVIRKMDVTPIFQLEMDKTYRITRGGWKKAPTEYGKDCERHDTFHENQYLACLRKGAEEVKAQVRHVLEDDRYEHVVLELSGGLDTRVIYAAATNVGTKALTDKIRIDAHLVAGSMDLTIATELNSIYGFLYDDLPRTQKAVFETDADQVSRSYYLGVGFEHNPYIFRQMGTCYPILRGGCGENIRPWLARPLFNTLAEHSRSVYDLADYVWGSFAANITAADKDSRLDFRELIGDELGEIPSHNILQPYDKFFLTYQCGYHFNSELPYYAGQYVWMPMQSKILYRLHHQTFAHFRSIKLELDLIAQLNPMLMAVRFDYEGDNEALASLKDSLAPVDPRFSNIHISGSNDMDRWNAATDKKNVSIQGIMDPPQREERKQEEWRKHNEFIYLSLKDNFRELMLRYPTLRERIGTALYYYIFNEAHDTRRMRFLYNKVTSLLDQDKIIRRKIDDGGMDRRL